MDYSLDTRRLNEQQAIPGPSTLSMTITEKLTIDTSISARNIISFIDWWNIPRSLCINNTPESSLWLLSTNESKGTV